MDRAAFTLAVCAGLQILGHTMATAPGAVPASACSLITRPRRRRRDRNIVTECFLPGVGQLCGFGHRGATTLAGRRPLGQVVSGVGNGSRPFASRPPRGALSDRIIRHYLPRPRAGPNPALADHILTRATGAELPPLELPDQTALRDTYL